MDQIKIKYYYEAYVDMVYKLGFTYMKKKTDAEDVVQEVFLRLVRQEQSNVLEAVMSLPVQLKTPIYL